MAEHRFVAPGVVGSIPTSRPKVPCQLSDRTLQNPVDLQPKHANQHNIYVGCSGWAYASWKPAFYPSSVSSKNFLAYYATQLNSVEVNYTFRSLPRRSMIDAWLAATNDSFRFSFKAPQRITHLSRLKNCREAFAAFIESIAPAADAGRLGIILLQLPPNMKADIDRLHSFFQDIASFRHRLAFEFRHESWFAEPVYALLRENSAALCVAESEDLTTPDIRTAPFSCYRLRKPLYSKSNLDAIKKNLSARATHGEVFAYFKHEEEPTGPLYAATVLHGQRQA